MKNETLTKQKQIEIFTLALEALNANEIWMQDRAKKRVKAKRKLRWAIKFLTTDSK